MIPVPYKMYVLALGIAGGLVVALGDLQSPPREIWYVVMLLAVLTFAVENLALSMPVLGSISLAYTFNLAAILFAGPLGGVVPAAAASVTVAEIRARKSPWLVGLNVAQLVLSSLVAGLVFRAAGGTALGLTDAIPVSFQEAVVPAALASVTLVSLNFVSVVVGISLLRSVSVREVWRQQSLSSYVTSFLSLALLGYLMAQLMVVADWLGILLLAIPLVVARETFQVYERLSDAYADTVRSLVRTLEAKDPYTRGHSERVSEYALALARKAGMPEPEVKMFRYAGLLHDIGKIGVLRDTLVKQGSLTAEEFDSIRRHPAVGADLLEPVEFLERVTPYIHAHHERVDGGGYPAGLAGDDIPWEARILSVADCFDAMTSNRAYRSAMSEEDACAELVRVSGTQLDGELVQHFLEVLAERAAADSERWASGEADG